MKKTTLTIHDDGKSASWVAEDGTNLFDYIAVSKVRVDLEAGKEPETFMHLYGHNLTVVVEDPVVEDKRND